MTYFLKAENAGKLRGKNWRKFLFYFLFSWERKGRRRRGAAEEWKKRWSQVAEKEKLIWCVFFEGENKQVEGGTKEKRGWSFSPCLGSLVVYWAKEWKNWWTLCGKVYLALFFWGCRCWGKCGYVRACGMCVSVFVFIIIVIRYNGCLSNSSPCMSNCIVYHHNLFLQVLWCHTST